MNTNFSKLWNRDMPASALMLAGALCIAAVVVMFGLWGLKSDSNSIVSTGSARERVTSDSAKITGDITLRVPASGVKAGYLKIANDKQKVLAYLNKQGAKTEDITFGSVYAGEVWNNNNGPREFDIKQSVTVQSADLDMVKRVSDNSSDIIQQDVLFQPYAVEYYYSKLPEKRRELLGKAVVDARERAQEIATSSGNKVGTLKSARAGVVQVLAPSSQNVDDYGSYDTSTVEKDVVVSVNATFAIK